VWRKSSAGAVKWSKVKCTDVRCNGAVGNLIGVKPYDWVVKCSGVERGEGFSNRVFIIISVYIYKTSHEVCCWYGSFVYHILLVLFCIIVYMVVCFVCFCLILLIVYYYYYYYYVCSVLGICFIVLFCVLFVCKCVLDYCHRVSTQMQLNTSISSP